MLRFVLGACLAFSIACPAALAKDAAAPAATRVMSFNIRYGSAPDGENRWELRQQMVLDVVRKYDPDLLGMQEVTAEQADFLKEHLPAYGFVGGGRDDGKRAGEFSPILYRKERYELAASGQSWLSDTPEKVGSKGWDAALPRIVTWTILKDRRDGGREVIYLNTHWDHKGNVARVESANVMRKLIEDRRGDRPAIVTGDFNSTEDSKQYRTLTGADGPEAARLIDAYRTVHPEPKADEATFNDFKGTVKGKRIDWILHSPDYTAKSAEIDRTNRDGRYPSDHYPVTAELERRTK